MTRLEMKNYNMILTEKKLKCTYFPLGKTLEK